MDYDGEKPHKSQIRLARLKGLEPLTHCLEGSCSIHLSYGRTLLSHWVLIWFAAVSRSTLREV